MGNAFIWSHMRSLGHTFCEKSVQVVRLFQPVCDRLFDLDPHQNASRVNKELTQR